MTRACGGKIHPQLVSEKVASVEWVLRQCDYKKAQNTVIVNSIGATVGVPTGGYPPVLHRASGSLHSLRHLYTRCGCRRRNPTPTVCAVSDSPIYDQLRGERINADVPASGADAQPGDNPGKHRLLAGGPGPATFARSPAAKANRPAGWSWFTASESAADTPRAGPPRGELDDE